jgi:hypothetical protein
MTMPDLQNPSRVIEAEIFSVGTWNGEAFAEQDLEEIARNFETLRDVLKPPLKLGHDPAQTLLGQNDGDPALGWVQALRVEDGKLIAGFAGVPEVVVEAIREGRYRHVSAELYFDVRHEGAELGKALKAVALLGADLPAVTNLEELSAYLDGIQDERVVVGETRQFRLDVRDGRIAPDPDESKGEVQTELAELRAFKAREESRRVAEAERSRQERFRASRAEAAGFAEQAVGEGKLAPHLRDRLLAELDAQSRVFSTRAPLAVSLDWVIAFVCAAAPVLPQDELAHASGADAALESEDPSRTLSRLASAKMSELNLSYGKAADYVLNTNPGLARAYRDYILKANAGG